MNTDRFVMLSLVAALLFAMTPAGITARVSTAPLTDGAENTGDIAVEASLADLGMREPHAGTRTLSRMLFLMTLLLVTAAGTSDVVYGERKRRRPGASSADDPRQVMSTRTPDHA